MILNLIIWYRIKFKPKFCAWLFRIAVSGKKVKIGKNFRCDTFPEIFITENGKLEIGDNVIFKRNVEVRVHKNAFMKIGSNSMIDRGVRLLATNSSQFILEDSVRVGMYSVFNGGDSITIKEKTGLSGFVYIQTSLHQNKLGEEIRSQGYIHAPVVIDRDVAVGAHASILPGCTVNQGCVIGTNSVVTRDMEENEVVMGVPIRKLKTRE